LFLLSNNKLELHNGNLIAESIGEEDEGGGGEGAGAGGESDTEESKGGKKKSKKKSKSKAGLKKRLADGAKAAMQKGQAALSLTNKVYLLLLCGHDLRPCAQYTIKEPKEWVKRNANAIRISCFALKMAVAAGR
jgi:hypothetical protein